MTHQDVSSNAVKPPQYFDSESSIVLPKQRNGSPASSLDSLPYRRSNPSLSNLYASTSLALSSTTRSARSSGTATPINPALAGSVFSAPANNGQVLPIVASQGRPDEPKNILLRAFAPHVGVLASAVTEEILASKGFGGGFLEIVRPYGEVVQGKVTIRDSTGASKSFEDFGIRFTGLKDALGVPRNATVSRSKDEKRDSTNGRISASKKSREATRAASTGRVGGNVDHVEELVDRHLSYSELQGTVQSADYLSGKDQLLTSKAHDYVSPFYSLYLRRLLSAMPMTPHETFSHPVACVIVISSRDLNPIEELRRLYASTNTGEERLPQWVNNEFLRYYVLVHDEDHDDISKSTQLYEQMKRSLGLHCHLLRLRSNQCVASDDDGVRLPRSEWVSAADELAEIQYRETSEDLEDLTPFLFESDATAIKTFVRELVTQSIIPSMERCAATWNEQVMTRRRGISGRLMSLSKRWTPFGSSSRNSSSPVGLQSSSNSNYDSLQGFYRPDAPEAIMRKLADYAFMLRDFKLASTTYDLLRGDFDNDKAWKYYAGANEMAAVSLLLNAQALPTKSRAESLDRMFEAASHSYIHRCIAPYYALRALTLGAELLKLMGSPAVDAAARWAARAVESGLVGAIGEVLYTERISACYASRPGIGSMGWGSRKRKAGFWALLASEAFLRLDKSMQSEKCLAEACKFYDCNPANGAGLESEAMRKYIEELREALVAARLAIQGFTGDNQSTEQNEEPPQVEEVSEKLDIKAHRRSLIGVTAPFGPLDTAPLSPARSKEGPLRTGGQDDLFQ